MSIQHLLKIWFNWFYLFCNYFFVHACFLLYYFGRDEFVGEQGPPLHVDVLYHDIPCGL